MHSAAAKAINLTEQGLVPDSVIRHGIRQLLRKRLASLDSNDCEVMANSKADFIRSMDDSPITPHSPQGQ